MTAPSYLNMERSHPIPKETFFNLPEEKRQKILDIAIEEFADNPYQAVSITRIVDRVGIAKGSFYQYFEDKKDLYLYLIELFAQEKAEFAQSIPPPDSDAGVFEFIRYLGQVGTSFELSNPKLGRISYRALFEDVPLPEESLKIIREGSMQFFKELIQNGMQSGELDPKLDPMVAAFIFNTIFMNMGKLMLDQLNIDIDEIASGERNTLDTPEGERLYDAALYILEHGMAKKETA